MAVGVRWLLGRKRTAQNDQTTKARATVHTPSLRMTLPSLATAAAAAVTTDTAPPASSTSSSSWRQPSLQQCKQYNIRPVQEDFVPTTEEQMLLDFYEYMKQMERLAQRLRTEAAMEKLAAKDAAFQQQQSRTHAEIQPRKKKRKKKRERNLDDVEDTVEDDEQEMEDVSEASADNLSDDNDDDDEDDDEDEDDEARNQRREAKLAALRAEVAQAKAASILAQEEEREKLIAHHLADHKRNDDDGDDEDDMAPTILKRKRLEPVEEQQSSAALIANLTATSTPPHDFSKSLELTASRGKVLFPTDPEQIKWTPPEGVFSPNDGAFCVPLENFDPNHLQTPGYGNTLAIKFAAPADAKRFSFNIASAASERDHFENILFHFNPRQRERGGQLIVNDKNDGIWGQALALPLSQVPLMFGQTACTIMIQINGDGFDIFLESKHCARLEHRQELPTGNLVLQFPSTDDYGSPENWAVYKVRERVSVWRWCFVSADWVNGDSFSKIKTKRMPLTFRWTSSPFISCIYIRYGGGLNPPLSNPMSPEFLVSINSIPSIHGSSLLAVYQKYFPNPMWNVDGPNSNVPLPSMVGNGVLSM